MTETERGPRADWAAVNDLFHRALDVPVGERAAFLQQACAGRTRLQVEVQSLLEAHERAGDFIEAPAVDAAKLAQVVLDPHFDPGANPAPPGAGPRARTGDMRGQYRIERVLGEGGMGIVYLAEDTRLGRRVALKAVATRFTGDDAHRERLRREARAAAALAHPGIATVYALEQFDDHLYIASEYVPGETLREELAHGPLPFGRLVDTALDLARALAAAHERGVIHRDLKPENVMRDATGRVKILDFGLAQFTDLPSAPSTPHLTRDGGALGTPAYMAPEQLRGQRAGAAADLFAFAVLVAEVGTGTHPFAGADSTSTIAKILEAEPVITFHPPSPPTAELAARQALGTILRVCLAKAPEARYATTAHLVGALETVRMGLSSVSSGPVPAGAPSHVSDGLALWWWQFHQAAATVAYFALLYPLSFVRETDQDLIGSSLFLIGVAAAAVSGTLRLHLWFTLRAYPAEWEAQRSVTGRWKQLADAVFVCVLLVAAVVVLTAHRHVAMLLVTSAVAVLLSFAVIEPVTTRAATKQRHLPS